MYRRFWLVILVCACAAFSAQAQTISTLPEVDRTNESFFLYEVKLIDEFIERFNDDGDSYLRTESKKLLGTDTFITRHRLIRSLFNWQQPWTADTASFLRTVLNEQHPQYISLTDTNLYAAADCTFESDGRKYQQRIVLQMRNVNNAWCWMIAGLEDIPKPSVTAAAAATPPARQPDPHNYIPTTAYGSSFAVLHSLLAPGIYAPMLFTPRALTTSSCSTLASQAASGQVHFLSARNITFHFYAIPGWVCSVSRFTRQHTNSGWLISRLQPANPREKAALLNSLLSAAD